MHISFNESATETVPSLACKLGADGCIRWRDMSACKLTYEDNPAELVEVWIAVKPRTAVVEVTAPEYEADTRFHPVYA